MNFATSEQAVLSGFHSPSAHWKTESSNNTEHNLKWKSINNIQEKM